MGRTRSYTIYQEDDLKNSNDNLIKEKFSEKTKNNLDDSFSDNEEDEYLGLKSGYKIELKELTLKEEEEIEEKELENTIKELNEKYRNKELFIYDDSDDEFDDLYKKSDLSTGSSNGTFDSSNFYDDEYMKNLIFHNVKNYDKLVKIMLIGEKEVGKTLFLNKILNKNIINEKYSSTEFLNIKKINTVINNQNIKLEFWDSNVNFLNSILINIYYKIANCFIIIVNEKSNFNFIEKQVSEIQSVNKTENIFFIFNCNLKENENINSLENEENFKKLCNDYYISFHRINLTEISLNNRDFSLFLESMILK